MANLNFELNAYSDYPEVILASFVWTVYEDLDVFVSQRAPLFSPTRGDADERAQMLELLNLLGTAWPEVMAQRPLTARAILNLNGDALAPPGLVGNQLRLKILAWERARNRFESVLIGRYDDDQLQTENRFAGFTTIRPAPRLNFQQRIARRLSARARTRLRRLNSLLAYADIPLGSLLALVPLVDPLVEVKQLVEQISGDLGSESELN
jgi:hypothetical protein